MFEDYSSIPRIPDNSKAGITVCLNQGEGDDPFEATVYFKKSGKNAEELREESAIMLTVSGKARLDIGKNGYVEIFAENSSKLRDAGNDEAAADSKEDRDVI